MGFESRFGGFAGWKISTGGYGWIAAVRRTSRTEGPTDSAIR